MQDEGRGESLKIWLSRWKCSEQALTAHLFPACLFELCPPGVYACVHVCIHMCVTPRLAVLRREPAYPFPEYSSAGQEFAQSFVPPSLTSLEMPEEAPASTHFFLQPSQNPLQPRCF